MFVASLCYWLWKGISSICCHRSMIAYHQHLFFFFFFFLICNFFVRLLELLSIKRKFITIYVTLLPFYIDLCWNLSAFLWIKCETRYKDFLFIFVLNPRWITVERISTAWPPSSDGHLLKCCITCHFMVLYWSGVRLILNHVLKENICSFYVTFTY